jgi:type IV pilus assembly protein PilA
MPRSTRRGGFTLIEMMITVAIIGILAAIAIPTFQMYQARSRRTESYTNLASLGRAQDAYFAEYNTFHDTGTSFPGGIVGYNKRRWDPASSAAFNPSGWAPEGEVMYDYALNAGFSGGCACTPGTCFTASAYGDTDADLTIAVVLLARADTAGGDCPDILFGVSAVDTGGARIYDRPLTWPELAGAPGKF